VAALADKAAIAVGTQVRETLMRYLPLPICTHLPKVGPLAHPQRAKQGLGVQNKQKETLEPTPKVQNDTGQLACMVSPLGVPGGLGRSLLAQHCIEGAAPAFT
jgi:hypothetical protein